MTVTIGRCVLPDPSDVSSGGGVVSMSGLAYSTETLVADRAAEMQAREMQLLGMVNNPDEDVFPVVWDAESRYDGFYRVLDASWSWVNDGSGRASVAEWSVTLEGIGTDVVYETSTVAVQRHISLTPTSATVTTHVDDKHLPSGGGYDPGSVTTYNRTGAEGTVIVTARSATLPWSYNIQIRRPADTYYDGAARIEIQGADNVWYPWVGRQLPSSAAGRWRIGNSLVRLTPAATVGDLTFEVYDATALAWEGYTVRSGTYQVVGGTWTDELFFAQDVGGNEWTVPEIIRNEPGKVIIAGTSDVLTTGGRRPVRQIMTLTAGAHHVEYFPTVPSIASFFHRYVAVVPSTAGSTAGLTQAVQANATDVSGNRYLFACTQNSDADTTNGRLRMATSSIGSLAIGIVKNAASPATNDAATAVVDQFAIGTSSFSQVVLQQ
jgi:hypothetical protein